MVLTKEKVVLTLAVFLTAFFLKGNYAGHVVSVKLDESYNYWSQIYYQENVSPALCSIDSIVALKSKLNVENLELDIVENGINQQCEQWAFLGAMLPKMARDMDVESRTFFKEQYAIAFYLSGLNPKANGSYHRKGWWQLTYPVAVKYGLRVDKFVDERLDAVKSSNAAAAYFADLTQRFQSTDLAIIAFVFSPIEAERLRTTSGRIELGYKHRKTLNDIKTYSTLFNWMLERMPYSVTKEKEDKLVPVMFNGVVVVDLLLEQTELTYNELVMYNPNLLGSLIPENYNGIKLPAKAKRKLKADELCMASILWLDSLDLKLAAERERIKKNLPDPNKTKVITHKVRSGESLGLISGKYHVKTKDIKSWNNLRSDMIYIGQKLVIYVPTNYKSSASKSTVNTTSTSNKESKQIIVIPDDESLVYTVLNGETLWSIAKKFPGVSAQNIMDWNGISENIKVGQKIKIKKSEIRHE